MENIIMIMPISTLVNELDGCMEKREKRKQQYIDGIKKLLEINDFFISHNIDIILIDNTNANTIFTEKLYIPNNLKFIGYIGNKYGAINKGSGLIESWEYLRDVIANYKYIIHFEPRQLLINHDTIMNMILNPANIFKILNNDLYQQHIYTGLFCIKSTDLLSFIHTYSAEYLAKNKISIEYILYDFMKNRVLTVISTLNLIRFDYVTKNIEFY